MAELALIPSPPLPRLPWPSEGQLAGRSRRLGEWFNADHAVRRQKVDRPPSVRQRARPSRLYVLFILRRLTLDASSEGYADGPGRASSKEGESWAIVAKLS